MERRRLFRTAGAVATLGLVQPWSARAAAEATRIALVVGNNAYKDAPLKNCVNDATAIAELLTKADFAVDLQLDATHGEFVSSVEKFVENAARGGVKVAVFYYAGHAVQVDWRNYLLPVDNTVASIPDLESQGIDLVALFEKLSKRGRASSERTLIAILDACRNDPFGQRYRAEREGLSQLDAPPGTLLAFSTAPGKVAADGVAGTHSLYAQNLLRELAVPNARIEDVFKRVRVSVRMATKGKQIPWESTSLERDLVLIGSKKSLSADELEAEFKKELARWQDIRASQDPQAWAEFLREFPNGKFSEIAQARLNQALAALESGGEIKTAPAPQPKTWVFDLRPGAPVPDLYGVPANPFSAGTFALARKYTVGDRAEYRQVDAFSRAEQRRYVQEVARVDEAADLVEFVTGERFDLLGNVRRFANIVSDVPVPFIPAELQVGKRWFARVPLKTKGREERVDLEIRIVAREFVDVPAGRFDAFRFEGTGLNPISRQTWEWTSWMAPRLNWPVKRDIIIRGTVFHISTATGVELVSLRQHLHG